MEGNYIKISRSILDWEWYKDINTYRLFTHMLLKTNWKDGRFMGREIPRGSFVSSYNRLSEETGLTVDELRTALKHLKSTGEITVASQSKYSVFTIENYCMYQDVPSQDPDSSQTVPSQIPDTPQSIPILFPTIEERKEREEQEERKEGKRKARDKDVVAEPATFPEDSFEMLCVNTLVHSCLEQFQGAKVPVTEKEKATWCVHIDRMERLDNRTEEDIKTALEFAVTDAFWKSNIRSAKKFREKFETLIVQAKRGRPPASRIEKIQNRVSEVDNW